MIRPSQRYAMQAVIAILCIVSIVGGLAYWRWLIVALSVASIEEIKQPGGPSKSAIAIWTFLGTCLLVWLLR